MHGFRSLLSLSLSSFNAGSNTIRTPTPTIHEVRERLSPMVEVEVIKEGMERRGEERSRRRERLLCWGGWRECWWPIEWFKPSLRQMSRRYLWTGFCTNMRTRVGLHGTFAGVRKLDGRKRVCIYAPIFYPALPPCRWHWPHMVSDKCQAEWRSKGHTRKKREQDEVYRHKKR